MIALLILGMLCLANAWAESGSLDVTGTVTIVRKGRAPDKPDNSNVAVWLKSLDNPATRIVETSTEAARPRLEIRQQHKRFDPHVLVVPAGSAVGFPNLDPFFHNVFSMFDGKRFDLGLYEAGTSRTVLFERPGVCYIFCNIHPEMSAVVVVVDTPYFAVSNRLGQFSIPNVPEGRYVVYVWHERAKPERPNAFVDEVTISRENACLPTIRLIDSGELIAPHKNKYGRDYDSPGPSAVYK